MLRFVLACAVCFVAVQDALAATPAPNTPPSSATLGRKQIEALLQAPADLDFGGRSTMRVGELLDMLHKRHHLSILFDIPSLTNLYGPGASANSGTTIASWSDKMGDWVSTVVDNAVPDSVVPSWWNYPSPTFTAGPAPKQAVAAVAPAPPTAPPVPTPPATRSSPEASDPPEDDNDASAPAQLTPDQQLVNQVKSRLSNQLHQDSINVKVADGACWLSGSVHDQQQSAAARKIAFETEGIKKVISDLKTTDPTPSQGAPAPESTAFPTGPAPPESCQRQGAVAAAAKQPETAQEFLKRAGKIEVSVAMVDGRTLSVATVLRMALDAFPNTSAEDSSGMPLAMTNASLLDFLVENDGILITTRLKALTYKETRVYSVKNLRDINLLELSKVIRMSVRPWSWRSRIDELGEQLKSGASFIPAAAQAQSEMELSADKKGISMEMTGKKMADPPHEMQQVAMIGNAVATAIVTLAHASLTTLEVIHYADPPTGSIQLLPGKLIITQSQAAHREITELLKQLSDE